MNKFHKKTIDLFKKIKYERFNEYIPKKIPVHDSNGNLTLFLQPITANNILDKFKINLLMKWRKENEFAYASRFKITYEGTKKWINNQIINNPTRILFFIITNEVKFKYIGHIGLSSFNFRNKSCEIDNVIRGNKKLYKGAMSLSLKALINWTKKEIMPNNIFLRVLFDNKHAINFYIKNKFKKYKLIPLKRIIKPGIEILKEDNKLKKSPHYFLKMVINNEKK